MKKILIAMAVVAGMAAFPNSAMACSCVGGLPVEMHHKVTHAVFIGEIVSVQHFKNVIPVPGSFLTGPGTIETTFTVIRAVRGTIKVGETVTVGTSDQESACGIVALTSQRAGTRWIIYASQPTPGMPLTTGRCSRTKPLSSPAAAEDLAFFDSLNNTQ